jgi:hypothetical protein
MVMRFTRVAWNEPLAQHYEKMNQYELDITASGSNQVGKLDGLRHNFVVYKYFEKDSCEAMYGPNFISNNN